VIENKKVEHIVNRILYGNYVFSHQDQKYRIQKPCLWLRVQSDTLYEETYEENLFSDFVLLEDIPNISISLGIIPFNYKEEITSLEKKIENLKVDYFSFFVDIDKKKRNKIKLNQAKQALSVLMEKVHYLDHLSIEHYCSKIKNEFIISNTLYYDHNNTLVFNDRNNIDYVFFNNIMSEINKNIIDIETYKEICRSEYWKNLWADSKHSIIDEPMCEWSEEQKTLCGLSKMYDRIYEHPECPSEAIIADSDALDGWIIHQKRENSKEKQEKGVNNMLSDKVKNSSEIFLLANSKEKADSIMEFNDKQALQKLNQKISFVKSHDNPVRDSMLPDVQQKIHEQVKQQKGK